MLPSGEEAGTKCHWMTGIQEMNLEVDILPTSGTGKSNTLIWYHNLQELPLGASCHLKLLEMTLTKLKEL